MPEQSSTSGNHLASFLVNENYWNHLDEIIEVMTNGDKCCGHN